MNQTYQTLKVNSKQNKNVFAKKRMNVLVVDKSQLSPKEYNMTLDSVKEYLKTL